MTTRKKVPRGTGPEIRCAHTELVDTEQLKPNPKNPNKHDKAQLEIYAKILTHQGWRKAITVSKNSGFIVTGHGAWMTAKANGWPQCPVDYQEFSSSADEVAHMIADNKLPQLAELDEGVVARLMHEELGGMDGDFDLDLTGFNLEELRELKVAPEIVEETPIDESADNLKALQDKWGTALGQLWELGEHRLLCGDSRSEKDLGALLGSDKATACVTDLPYNIGKDYGTWDDSLSEKAFWQEVLPAWVKVISVALKDESHFITSFSQSGMFKLIAAAEACGFQRRHVGVWHNPDRLAGSHPGQWPFCWEPIVDFSLNGWSKLRNGNGVGCKDVWILASPITSKSDKDKSYHPCEKPTELFRDLIQTGQRFERLDL